MATREGLQGSYKAEFIAGNAGVNGMVAAVEMRSPAHARLLTAVTADWLWPVQRGPWTGP